MVFGLQIFGKIISHSWTPVTGALVGILVVPVAFAAAFTAKTPSKTELQRARKNDALVRRPVVVWFVVFKVLDIVRARRWTRVTDPGGFLVFGWASRVYARLTERY
jgi:hypothetical protein